MFNKFMHRMLVLARHKGAIYFLAFFSFIESIFWPIPADPILIPMVASKPQKAWLFVGVVVFFSLLGAIITYSISYYAFDTFVLPIIEGSKYHVTYNNIVRWFAEWGIGVFLVVGILPIPYKITSICAGALAIGLHIFIVITIIVRTVRFSVVALAIKNSGFSVRKYIDKRSQERALKRKKSS